MAYDEYSSHLFRWKKPGNKTSVEKRVETASKFAVSEVFSHKKPHIGSSDLAMPLQTSAQLKDHDDAYSEAQALLGDWLHGKLRLELEMDEEDDLIFPAEKHSPIALDICTPTAPNYTNFDDFYSCLIKEEESSTINNCLQELMEQEVLDSVIMDQLAMDVGQTRKKFRNSAITMEERHKQVHENKARRDAERQRQQRARETLQEAREETWRRERKAELRRRQQARRQEDMLQQEMVRLRRQMEEQRCIQQLARQRKRDCAERAVVKSPQCASLILMECQKMDQQQLYKEQQALTLLYMNNFKCLQRHFTAWFSVVLNQRIHMDKAKTVCEWRRKLRVWRAWRAQVLLKQQQQEVQRTEEELREENRLYILAVQTDNRRLLRRFLNEWQVWAQMEREQRKLLSQQQETRHKMAALISAVTSGKLRATQNPTCQAVMAPAKAMQTEYKRPHQSAASVASDTSLVHQEENPGANMAPMTQPTEPWQISRQHVAPTGAEIQRALHKDRGSSCLKNLTAPGARFEHRHTTQLQIIYQQRKLLKEQQEQIVLLQKEQLVMGLELEEQKSAQRLQLAKAIPWIHKAPEGNGQPDTPCGPQKKTVTRQTCPHPIIVAMETRARQRAERRKQVEEIKRRKEDEKLAEMKAAEEQRQREEEKERRRAVEKRREERRVEKEREDEKQRRLRRQQELMSLARQHYHRTLLKRNGLAPWKRLVQQTQANMQLAQSHHDLSLLRQCTLSWQRMAQESLSEKKASADQLHQHFLLRRSLGSWKKLMDWQLIQEQRAKCFYRVRTLRRVLQALQHLVIQERLLEWDRQELAEKQNSRRVLQRWFLAWRQLPVLLRREREKEQRREKLVRKVVEILPDFCSHQS
ncbi:coiled-coil domain-containing protein 191 isoform X2 [Boleophthalmus pectinirostris]|uniref:coiled-coil domain-containing protein 191 isoform X2 n=1 Tax=Boleophthalmus pectinirostris TaxID=150288 RepID=UPI00242A452E|nr:coiled-coil domain-containing protein 191 isoform X2 [Boleophthalmus pectinirostris]